MSNRYAGALTLGNPTPSVCVRSMRTPVRLRDALMRVCRAIFPHNTAAELASRTAVSVRSAEFWLSGRSGMSADAFAALLRSDVGFEVLEVAMGEAKPEWWRRLQRQADLAATRQQIEAATRRLAKLEAEQ